MARRATRRASGSRGRSTTPSRSALPTNKAFLAAVLRDDEFAARRRPRISSHALSRDRPAKPDAATLAHRGRAARRNAGYGEWNSWSNNPARAMRGEVRRQRRRASPSRRRVSRARSATPRSRCASCRSIRRMPASRSTAPRRPSRFADRGRHDPPRARRREPQPREYAARAGPARRGRERRPAGRADERPRGRGERQRRATTSRPGARWSCSRR